jgi:uncharacterized protein (DUF2147 family)
LTGTIGIRGGRGAAKVETLDMKLYQLCLASAVVLPALIGAGAAAADPRGLWLAEDGAKVRVSNCGKALCATIASAKSAVDPATGAPWTDKHNADAALRGRPLVGVQVLSAMQPDGPGKWSGQLYNSDDGQTYPGHLVEIDHKTIRIEGCALGICGGKNLSRIH